MHDFSPSPKKRQFSPLIRTSSPLVDNTWPIRETHVHKVQRPWNSRLTCLRRQQGRLVFRQPLRPQELQPHSSTSMSPLDRPLLGDGDGKYRISIVGNSGAGKVFEMYTPLAP